MQGLPRPSLKEENVRRYEPAWGVDNSPAGEDFRAQCPRTEMGDSRFPLKGRRRTTNSLGPEYGPNFLGDLNPPF